MPAGALEGAVPPAGAPSGSLPAQSRRSSKPIMEKRRRARINESLGQLKTLILHALKKDTSRHSKLEKADILEMTVKHLRNLQRLQITAAVNTDPSILSKYRAGFSECVGEVTRFLSACEGVTAEVRTRLLGHLATCVTQINSGNPHGPHLCDPRQTGSPVQAPSASQTVLKAGSQVQLPPEAVTLCGGFRVVPSSDGQFAILVPLSAAQNCYGASPVAPAVTSDFMWRPW